jgi:hypothetical protein
MIIPEVKVSWGGRRPGGYTIERRRFGLLDLLALDAQQLRQPAAFASGDKVAACRLIPLIFRFDHRILDHTLKVDTGGQRLDGGAAMRHLAGIARGLLQLVQGNENLDATDGLDLNGIGRCLSPSNHTHPGMGWAAKELAVGPRAEPGSIHRTGTQRR